MSDAIEISVTGVDEVREFLNANSGLIYSLRDNPIAKSRVEQYLHGELEIVGSELSTTSTGIAVRLYVTEGFRELLAAAWT